VLDPRAGAEYIPNAVNITRLAVPMSGSSRIGTAITAATSSDGTTPRTSERMSAPMVESFAARNSTSVSLAISEGWKLKMFAPSQRRAPPVCKPTCGIRVSTSMTTVTPTSAGETRLSLV